ncbi:MAG TPA: hypothetical protein VGH71_04320 [Gammaproteobacteria bacterium]
MFGIPYLSNYILLCNVTAMIYFAYRTYAGTRQWHRDAGTLMSRTGEIAAKNHEDAERIIELLTEIRDQLKVKA